MRAILYFQGLALAVLAWVQTLPEFAVEATIALEAARTRPSFIWSRPILRVPCGSSSASAGR